LIGGKKYALPGKGTISGKNDSRIGDKGLGNDQAIQSVLEFPQGIRIIVLPGSIVFEDAKPGIPIGGNNHIIKGLNGRIKRRNPAVKLIIYIGKFIFQGEIGNVSVYRYKKDKQEEGKEEKD
jgi:hypothetical protein